MKELSIQHKKEWREMRGKDETFKRAGRLGLQHGSNG